MITLFGTSIGMLISSSLLTEAVFGWPGIGQLMLEAVQARDFFLVVDSAMLSTAFFLLGTLVADILLYAGGSSHQGRVGCDLSRLPVLSLAVLAACYGSAALAGFIAPYSFETQNRDLNFVPPTRVHVFDRSGRFHFRPFVYRSIARPDSFAEYVEDTSVALSGPLSYSWRRVQRFSASFTMRVHLFGVQAAGADIPAWERCFRAGRVLPVALWSSDIADRVVSGGADLRPFGHDPGWRFRILRTLGGRRGVMRISEVFLAMPWLYLLLAVRAALPLHMDARQSYFFLAVLMGLVGWARPARLARGIVLSVKEAEYVMAARSFGGIGYLSVFAGTFCRPFEGVLLTQLSIYIPQYILAEVTLSFLGLGVSEPIASWGNMLGDLQLFVSDPQWWLFSPAVRPCLEFC